METDPASALLMQNILLLAGIQDTDTTGDPTQPLYGGKCCSVLYSLYSLHFVSSGRQPSLSAKRG